MWHWFRLIVIWRVDVFIGSAIWAEIHVFVRVMAAAMVMWYVGGGIVQWAIMARRAREDGTKFSNAGEDVGRKWGRRITLDALCRICEVLVIPLCFEIVVNRGATAAGRLAGGPTVALTTIVASTAARRRFTL